MKVDLKYEVASRSNDYEMFCLDSFRLSLKFSLTVIPHSLYIEVVLQLCRATHSLTQFFPILCHWSVRNCWKFCSSIPLLLATNPVRNTSSKGKKEEDKEASKSMELVSADIK